MTMEAREAPPHGFPAVEFEARAARAQRRMTDDGLDALLVTTPHNVRYFTGFATEFWESPTRPWFVVVPRQGKPIAVVPEVGGPAMARTWLDDVRAWPAPRPDDDGVSLLAEALVQLPRRFGRVGLEFGRESVVRMPAIDLDRVRERCPGLEFVNGSPAIWALRGVKSPAEVARVRHACELVSDGFAALPAALAAGDSERQAVRKLKLDVLARGADAVPFMVAASGPGGYDQIIAGPTDRTIGDGDVLIIDTGAVYDGYSSDFDRNYAFGRLDDAARRAHEACWDATKAGIAAARPGATAADLWRAQNAVLEAAGSIGNNVGRLGHGLGMQLTEPPSNMPGDETPLIPGMVMTIEPGMEYAPGKMIVHEENVVVTEDGCDLLTTRAPREMWTVDG